MEDSLIEILSGFGVPVIRQGSLAPDEVYPPTFFTFWNNEETGESYYDNETKSVFYSFDVNVYSEDVEKTYSFLKDARAALKASGWNCPERGHDVASDEITHTGRGFTATFLEMNPTD